MAGILEATTGVPDAIASNGGQPKPSQNDGNAKTVAARLWQDRAQIREQERNELQARLRIAEEKLAILTAENDRLATENAQLRARLNPGAADVRTETEMQMEALKSALLPLLSHPTETMNRQDCSELQ